MVQPMGDESSTAQVHPQKLSQALMDAAQQKGAHLRIGEVQNITTSGKKVTGAHSPPEESFTQVPASNRMPRSSIIMAALSGPVQCSLLPLLRWCNAA